MLRADQIHTQGQAQKSQFTREQLEAGCLKYDETIGFPHELRKSDNIHHYHVFCSFCTFQILLTGVLWPCPRGSDIFFQFGICTRLVWCRLLNSSAKVMSKHGTKDDKCRCPERGLNLFFPVHLIVALSDGSYFRWSSYLCYLSSEGKIHGAVLCACQPATRKL